MSTKLDYSRKTNRFIKSYTTPAYKPSTVYSIESRLKFGKHIGRRMADVLKTDKPYLVWILKNTDIKMSVSLVAAINKK